MVQVMGFRALGLGFRVQGLPWGRGTLYHIFRLGKVVRNKNKMLHVVSNKDTMFHGSTT